MCKYTKNEGLDSREITSKTWWTWRVISITAENKPHAHHKIICIQWKFTTPDQLASPSKFCLLRFFFFSTTKVITFRKSSTSLILCKLSMHNVRHAATLAYLQVLRTLLGTLEIMIPLLARTHKKKKEKRRLHLESRSWLTSENKNTRKSRNISFYHIATTAIVRSKNDKLSLIIQIVFAAISTE